MLPFFWYMLKVLICSGILFGYYWFFLRNKIFHQYNRFYLLAAMSLSLLLPLVKINFWQPSADTNQAIRVLQAVSAGDEYMNNIILTAKKSSWTLEQLYPVVYILVSLIFFFVMLRTLLLIRTLLKKYPVQEVEQVAFINTQDDRTPFSFFKYIFWNSNIDLETTTGRQIFKHEVAHIQEKHTHDKLFVNIILIFCWCNPFFWLYRKELNMIHEFIADKKAVEDSDTSVFAAMILQAAYPKHRFELANNFFYSPIKRRLLMLTKNKNPRVNYLGRIMVLPLAVLVFTAFTFKAKTGSSIYHGKKITVVIDAGHGGQDAGATGTDGTLEKDLTLAIAKKVKDLNSNDAIEIVLVRDGDVYMNPQQKVGFGKSKNADLFISFHVENGPKELADTKTGMSVLFAKNESENAAESKVLASAIVNEFSDNYGLAVTAQPIQRQQGIYILQANTCPAVLIESGFLNNQKDLAYLQTSAAKETIAKNLLSAIEKYLSNIPKSKTLGGEYLPTKQQWEASASTVVNKTDTAPKLKSVTVQDAGGKAIIEIEKNNPNLLFVLDGVVQGKDFNLNQVKPNDIERIDVIKNEAAIAKYGQAGKEGVIIIKTKKLEITGINPNGAVSQNDVLERKLTALELEQAKQKLSLAYPLDASQYEVAKLELSKKSDSLKAITVTGIKLNALEKQSVELARQNKLNAENADRYKEITVTGYPLEKNKLLEKQIEAEQNNIIFVKTEVSPMFTGGEDAWRKYLMANLKAATPVDEGWKAGKYIIIVKFIVHADGTVSDVTTENYIGSKTALHCIEVIKNAPKWQPAVQNGRKVNAYKKQPITFVIEE